MVFLVISLTNLDPEPIMIESYALQLLTPRNGWKWLTTIHPGRGVIYNTGKGFDQAKRSNVEQDTFDSAIIGKNIDSGKTVRGWMFVELPEADYENMSGQKREARFRMTTVRGVASVVPVEFWSGTDRDPVQANIFRIG